MDDRVKKLDTPEKCEIFARNARKRDREDLALEANQKAVQLRAESYGATSQVEREVLQAVYAYEEVLSKKNGRRTRASRTWPMIKRHGIIEAAERAVNRDAETQGYTALLEMGLADYAFEAVILRHPEFFSDGAIARSKERIEQWKK